MIFTIGLLRPGAASLQLVAVQPWLDMADVQPSQPSLEAVAAQQQLIIDTINTLWVIYGSIFVFFMQVIRFPRSYPRLPLSP